MNHFAVGERVRDEYGRTGAVTRVWDDFSSVRLATFSTPGDADEWLEAQEFPFANEELLELWYSVAIEPRGGILSPHSRLSLPT